MIRPLRRAHRVIAISMAALLPLGLGAALLGRTGPFVLPMPPGSRDTWTIRIEPPGITVERPDSVPEVLAYLEPDARTDAPGPASRLLGPLGGKRTRFELPPGASGQVLLYSPALQQTLARRRLP